MKMATTVKLTFCCLVCCTFANTFRLQKRDKSMDTATNSQNTNSDSGGYLSSKMHIGERNMLDLKKRYMNFNTEGLASSLYPSLSNPIDAKISKEAEKKTEKTYFGNVHNNEDGLKQNSGITTDGSNGASEGNPTKYRRQKRGFRSSVADRIAHGFGKRAQGLRRTDYIDTQVLPRDTLSESFDMSNLYNDQNDYNDERDFSASEDYNGEIQELVDLLHKYRENSLESRISGLPRPFRKNNGEDVALADFLKNLLNIRDGGRVSDDGAFDGSFDGSVLT